MRKIINNTNDNTITYLMVEEKSIKLDAPQTNHQQTSA